MGCIIPIWRLLEHSTVPLFLKIAASIQAVISQHVVMRFLWGWRSCTRSQWIKKIGRKLSSVQSSWTFRFLLVYLQVLIHSPKVLVVTGSQIPQNQGLAMRCFSGGCGFHCFGNWTGFRIDQVIHPGLAARTREAAFDSSRIELKAKTKSGKTSERF